MENIDNKDGSYHINCPNCGNSVMIEGLEENESMTCPYCKTFGAVESVWRELKCSDAIEL